MTQTLIPGPRHAMVINASAGSYLHTFAVQTPEEARNELGGTLADALLFVEGVCCTECGTEASETREGAVFELTCQSCKRSGCRCILTEDPHARDAWFCEDCASVCDCRSCEG
jgi:hypothetical protein